MSAIDQSLLSDARLLRYVSSRPDPAPRQVVMNAPRPLFGVCVSDLFPELSGFTYQPMTDSEVVENLRLDASLLVWTDRKVAISDARLELIADYGLFADVGMSDLELLGCWASHRTAEGQIVRLTR